VGTYQQLYQDPVNLFVGGFVGTPLLNSFAGEVVDGLWQGEVFGGYPIRRDLEGERIILGVRPEHVKLSDDGTAAVVERVTPYFAERYNLIDVYSERTDWQLTVPLDMKLQVGETIHCMLDPATIHFFDFKTGQRVG
jgi:multiple sugar transport system ATP-binding protein